VTLLALPPIVFTYSSSPFLLYALPISSSFMSSFPLHLVKSTSYEVPLYAVFSNLLPLQSSSLKYSSQHPLIKHSPSMFLP
jgi:hypothetical protein